MQSYLMLFFLLNIKQHFFIFVLSHFVTILNRTAGGGCTF